MAVVELNMILQDLMLKSMNSAWIWMNISGRRLKNHNETRPPMQLEEEIHLLQIICFLSGEHYGTNNSQWYICYGIVKFC